MHFVTGKSISAHLESGSTRSISSDAQANVLSPTLDNQQEDLAPPVSTGVLPPGIILLAIVEICFRNMVRLSSVIIYRLAICKACFQLFLEVPIFTIHDIIIT